MSSRVWLGSVLVALGAVPAYGQAGAPVESSERELLCAYQRKSHPAYIMWICNPEGTEASTEGSILWLRRNAGGAKVMTSVWRGPSLDLVHQAEDIITRHERRHARCQGYFHVARARGREISWNVGTPAMIADVRAFSGTGEVCYAPEPGAADYIVFWSENAGGLPEAFTVDIPPGVEPDPGSVDAPRAGDGEPATSSIAVYRVDPGMNHSIVRIGLAVFTPRDAADGADGAPVATGFTQALRFVAAQTHGVGMNFTK
jgi:hypothetical protein